MRKSVFISLAALSVAAFFAAGIALAGVKHGERISIKLTPVPKVKTSATGTATFELAKNGTALDYRVNLKGIRDVTMGHIHAVGDDGTPAEIIAWLYPTTGEAPALREGIFKGTLAKGEITADKLGGPLKGKTVKDLYEMLEKGKAGVAIHTKESPGGELWAFHKETGHKKMKM